VKEWSPRFRSFGVFWSAPSYGIVCQVQAADLTFLVEKTRSGGMRKSRGEAKESGGSLTEGGGCKAEAREKAEEEWRRSGGSLTEGGGHEVQGKTG
jgi:hypothetical protein